MIGATRSDLEEPSETEDVGFFRSMGTSAKQGVSRMADAIDEQATSMGNRFRGLALWRSEPKPMADDAGASSSADGESAAADADGESEPKGLASPAVCETTRVRDELFSKLWEHSPSRQSISSDVEIREIMADGGAELLLERLDNSPPPSMLSEVKAESAIYDSDGEVPGETSARRKMRKQLSLSRRAREKLQRLSVLPVDLCCVSRSKVQLVPMEGLPDSPSPVRKGKDLVQRNAQFQI